MKLIPSNKGQRLSLLAEILCARLITCIGGNVRCPTTNQVVQLIDDKRIAEKFDVDASGKLYKAFGYTYVLVHGLGKRARVNIYRKSDRELVGSVSGDEDDFVPIEAEL